MPSKTWMICGMFLHVALSLARASPGDRDPVYRGCVHRCAGMTGCAKMTTERAAHGHCPLQLCRNEGSNLLRGFGWDCAADCRYHCMHALEDSRQVQGMLARKYHGKWPFVRVLGMQEVFSVSMSLGNLAVHLIGAANFFRRSSHLQGSQCYGAAWKIYIGVSICAWIASAVFHSRDTAVTEKLDYMAAFATVVTGSAVSVIRCFGISRYAWQGLMGAAFSVVWAGHMYYMIQIKFDYGWNMQLCVTLGLAQAMLWIVWSQNTRHRARKLLLAFVLAVNGAMLFELLDFRPIFGVVDAHGIWHALTIFITPLWYQFMITDTEDLTKAGAIKAK